MKINIGIISALGLCLLIISCNSEVILKPLPQNIEMIPVKAGEYVREGGMRYTFLLEDAVEDNIAKINQRIKLTRDYEISKYEITAEQFATVYNYGLDLGLLSTGHNFHLLQGVRSTVVNESGIMGFFERWLFEIDENRWDFSPLIYGRDSQLVLAEPEAAKKVIVGVSWWGAIWFCNLLSRIEGLPEYYEIQPWGVSLRNRRGGYRLPTEAEWEWAALGGVKSLGYKYIGTDEETSSGYHRPMKAKISGPIEGGQFVPNELGIYDMSGNVREWVWDWLEMDYSETLVDPLGPESGYYRVVKGSSWNYSNVPLWSRYGGKPSERNWEYGIRVVRDIVN